LRRDERPVALDVVAFRQGWNRRGLTITDGALESLAESGKDGGWPVYYGHQLDDRTQEEGVGLTAWVDGEEGSRELRARIRVDGSNFRKSLARGVRPKFSIGWDTVQATELTCDECGEDLIKGACIHPAFGAGITLDGAASLVELSRFPRVASEGTGATLVELSSALRARLGEKLARNARSVMGAQLGAALEARIAEMTTEETPREAVIAAVAQAAGLDAEAFGQVLSGELMCPAVDTLGGLATATGLEGEALKQAAESDGCVYEEEEAAEEAPTPAPVQLSSPEEVVPAPEMLTELTALKAENEQLKATVAIERATRLKREAQEVVRKYRTDGRLVPGDEDKALQLYIRHADVITRWMEMVPPNDGYSMGQMSSAPRQAEPQDPREVAADHHVILERMQAFCADHPEADPADVWKAEARRFYQAQPIPRRSGRVHAKED
jgi:hypothetical protein